MAVEVRDRPLSRLAKALALKLWKSSYEAFRSVGTKRHGDRTMGSQRLLAGSLAVNCSILRRNVGDGPT